jgi:hypothetical protein
MKFFVVYEAAKYSNFATILKNVLLNLMLLHVYVTTHGVWIDNWI